MSNVLVTLYTGKATSDALLVEICLSDQQLPALIRDRPGRAQLKNCTVVAQCLKLYPFIKSCEKLVCSTSQRLHQ
jgi:hypothetical protein